MGACLTAGNNTGSIPACVGLPYHHGKALVGGAQGRLPDADGQGALRLTDGGVTPGGRGAVVSKFTFPTSRGLKVTFTTATYGGNDFDGRGADGIGFFLADGSRSPHIGGGGGALGYSCRNYGPQYDGVDGGYIGLGIDEFGNFSNPGDNTSSGPGFQPGRISLRGAGSTLWRRLKEQRPTYYPPTLSAALQEEAVHNTCRTGQYWNYSGSTVLDATGATIADGAPTHESLEYNYPFLAARDLPRTATIANQQGWAAPKRSDATPITYVLDISQDGMLNFSFSYNGGSVQPVLVNKNITASNGPLPDSFRFGFSGSTGSGTNVHEITCFKAAPLDYASTSSATNMQPAARLQTLSQLFLAFNHPLNWWGQLTAQSLLVDPADDTVSIRSAANWDAHCALTGGACAAIGGGSVAAQAPASRKLLTWNGSAGIPFEWASLSSAQRAQLTTGDAAVTDARLRYLRGVRDDEVANGGRFRSRTGLLGDMQDSSPSWVGAPASPYSIGWSDYLRPGAAMPEAAGQSYAAFKSEYGGRQNLVYVGANDGWLHAFRAGASDANGKLLTSPATPNDGREALAYMPAAVVSAIHSSTTALDYSNPLYSHNLFVDATPGTGDLYYGGAWHTWLVSGTGPARDDDGPVSDPKSSATGVVFALDITDPRRFSEANAASVVRGEWDSRSIACVNDTACGAHLGAVSGTPQIRRLHSGHWAAIFGNGLNSAGGTAGLFIMMVDPASGAVSFRYLDTGVGPAADPAGRGSLNGIVNVTAADLDGDHITDYVYAGDAFGNLWRFDVSSADPAEWSTAASPMFRTASGQPITGRVAVASVPAKGKGAKPRLVVSFGTGRQTPQSLISAPQFAKGQQALYGIWDWDLMAWNGKAGPTGQYEALNAPRNVTVSTLQRQAITSTLAGEGAATGYRTVSQKPVCWAGSSDCETGNTQFGWTLPLPGTEQVVYNPSLLYGTFVVNTMVPAVSDPLACRQAPASGYTMAVDVATGGASKNAFFPDVTTPLVAGISLSATGSQSLVTTQKKAFIVQQTVEGQGVVTRINPSVGSGRRLNWLQMR